MYSTLVNDCVHAFIYDPSRLLVSNVVTFFSCSQPDQYNISVTWTSKEECNTTEKLKCRAFDVD